MIEEPLGDTRAFGDRVHGHGFITVLGEVLPPKSQQLLPSSFSRHPPGAKVHNDGSMAIIDDSSIAILYY
jgi:hypothetical protein